MINRISFPSLYPPVITCHAYSRSVNHQYFSVLRNFYAYFCFICIGVFENFEIIFGSDSRQRLALIKLSDESGYCSFVAAFAGRFFSFFLFQLKSLENNYHDLKQTHLLPNQDDLRITLFRLS